MGDEQEPEAVAVTDSGRDQAIDRRLLPPRAERVFSLADSDHGPSPAVLVARTWILVKSKMIRHEPRPVSVTGPALTAWGPSVQVAPLSGL